MPGLNDAGADEKGIDVVEVIRSLWWTLPALGCMAGILGATLGIGGGIIMVPALVILYSCPQKSAQGMSLLAMIPMAIVGSWRYKRHVAVDLDLGLAALVAMGAVVGAVLGSEIAARLQAHTLRRIFGVLLLLLGLHMCLSNGPKKAWMAPRTAAAPAAGASADEPVERSPGSDS